MKIIDTPRVNKLGTAVAYQSPYGLCLRNLVIPRNTLTPARSHMRAIFGITSRTWSARLTDEQRDRWNYAGAQVMSHPTLGQRGPLSGQQFHQAINSVRGCIGMAPALEPPAPVTFGPSVVGQLTITNDENGVRLWLELSGELNEDVMVFGQEPCSAGRSKRRNVAYLGLLPPPINGRCEITNLYKARYGEPRPDTRVFIVTCQTKDGWKAADRVTNARVPSPPEAPKTLPTAPSSRHNAMHKGCSPPPQAIQAPLTGDPVGGKAVAEGGSKAAEATIDGAGGVETDPGGSG